MLRLTNIHARFGVEVYDIDLCEVSEEHLYLEIRAAFEERSLLVFRSQELMKPRIAGNCLALSRNP